MRFVKSASGRALFNLDHVVKIEETRAGGSLIATIKDGREVEIDHYRIDALESLLALVIPAQPGFEALTLYFGDDGMSAVFREPIIAWRFKSDYDIEAITPDGTMDGYMVLYPDGQVCSLGDHTWPSEKAWIEWEKAERDKAAA